MDFLATASSKKTQWAINVALIHLSVLPIISSNSSLGTIAHIQDSSLTGTQCISISKALPDHH